MMLLPSKKNMASLIISKIGKPDSENEEVMEGEAVNDQSVAAEHCANKLIEAIHAKDSASVVSHLADLLDIIQSNSEESESE
jgi:hypothetical protein